MIIFRVKFRAIGLILYLILASHSPTSTHLPILCSLQSGRMNALSCQYNGAVSGWPSSMSLDRIHYKPHLSYALEYLCLK